MKYDEGRGAASFAQTIDGSRLTRIEGNAQSAGRARLVRAIALALTLSAANASAQDAVPATGTTQSGLEEIMVTAQRRAEDIADVPISMAAFTGDSLQRMDIGSTDDLQIATPGLVNTQTSGDGISAVYIRGVGTGYSGPGLEGSVAFYVDDVYLQTQTSSAQGAIDIDRIQVLKGPQGTLYGRNATGGAVLLTTNDPTLEKVDGYVKTGLGNLNWSRVEGVLNTPLSNTVSNRIAGFYDARDGYARNVAFPDQEDSGVGAGYTWSIRDKLLWQPTDDLKFVLWGQSDRRNGNGAIHSLRYNGDGTRTSLGFYETMQSRNREGGGGDDTDANMIGLRAEYGMERWTLSNTFAWRKTRAYGCTDNDAVPEELLYFCTVSQRSPNPGSADGKEDETYTDEFRVVSDFGGPFELTAGLFYESNSARFVGRIGGAFFDFTPTGTPTFDNRDELEAFSAYFDSSYELTDRIKVTAGVRYTDEQKDHSFRNDEDAQAFGVPESGKGSVSFDDFSPRIVLSYDGDATNYYLSYNQGFKSGGFNSPSMTLDPVLKPESIDAYEIGAKHRTADGNLLLGTAVYYYDWKNQQVAFITGGGAGIQQQNAAQSEIYGAEITADYSIEDAWIINAGAAYTHARYSSFPNAAVYNIIDGALTATAEDLEGERLPQAPDFTGNLNVTYQFDLPSGYRGGTSAGARYTSEYDFAAGGGGELNASHQDAYTMVNLTAWVRPPGERFELGFFVSNLLDEEYYSLVSTGNTGVYATPAEPRLYGATLRFLF